MKNAPFTPTRDPFAPLAALTAAALTGPLAPPRPAQDGGTPSRTPRERVSLFDRLDNWLWRARQVEFERTLASSGDVVELEARIRARQVGVLHRYY